MHHERRQYQNWRGLDPVQVHIHIRALVGYRPARIYMPETRPCSTVINVELQRLNLADLQATPVTVLVR